MNTQGEIYKGQSQDDIDRARELAIISVIAIDGGKVILNRWETQRSNAKEKLERFERKLKEASLTLAS